MPLLRLFIVMIGAPHGRDAKPKRLPGRFDQGDFFGRQAAGISFPTGQERAIPMPRKAVYSKKIHA